jgi:hypothetical protein
MIEKMIEWIQNLSFNDFVEAWKWVQSLTLDDYLGPVTHAFFRSIFDWLMSRTWDHVIYFQFGVMNEVNNLAWFMNWQIFAHVVLIHVTLLLRIYFFYFISPHLITPDLSKLWVRRYKKYQAWIPMYITQYIIFALMCIPFYFWYVYSWGQFWYFSHYYFVLTHMVIIATIITTFIYHERCAILTFEHVYTYLYYYLKFFLFSAWLLYACVNGNDEGDWWGWDEDDLYRFNNRKPGSINWWDSEDSVRHAKGIKVNEYEKYPMKKK